MTYSVYIMVNYPQKFLHPPAQVDEFQCDVTLLVAVVTIFIFIVIIVQFKR